MISIPYYMKFSRVVYFAIFMCAYFATLMACLHGGGGPQVGEVTRLGGVKKYPPLHAIL